MPQPAVAEPAIGFYTVEQSEFTGWTGGLLVLNSGGRPVEFQCTLPVRPTRAHEILFGAALRDYLIGEAIGPLLISRCRNPPSIILCDQVEALQLDTHANCALALVCEAAETDEGPISDDMLPGFDRIALAGSTIRVATERAEEVRQLIERLGSLPDLIEPFDRIREAIGEAHKQVARSRSVAAA
jgi:hypothetical protein